MGAGWQRWWFERDEDGQRVVPRDERLRIPNADAGTVTLRVVPRDAEHARRLRAAGWGRGDAP